MNVNRASKQNYILINLRQKYECNWEYNNLIFAWCLGKLEAVNKWKMNIRCRSSWWNKIAGSGFLGSPFFAKSARHKNLRLPDCRRINALWKALSVNSKVYFLAWHCLPGIRESCQPPAEPADTFIGTEIWAPEAAGRSAGKADKTSRH